jgi:hypothetical protein
VSIAGGVGAGAVGISTGFGTYGGFAALVNGTYSNELYATYFDTFVDEHLAASTAAVVAARAAAAQGSNPADADAGDVDDVAAVLAVAASSPIAGSILPFFAYVAFHNVHLPLEAPLQYLALYNDTHAIQSDWDRLQLVGMVTAVDDSIGRVVAKLEAAQMWDNTIMIITTDNGAPVCTGAISKAEGCRRNCGGSNGLLRGSKMTDWEGGVRGFALVAGGSNLISLSRRGSVYDGLLHQTDLYSTFASLGGVSGAAVAMSGPVAPDGMNVWEAITSGGASPRTDVVHNIFGTNPGAIRVGEIKLVWGDPDLKKAYNGYNGWNNTNAGLPKGKEPLCTRTPCLYNMSSDRGEHHDLSKTQPALLQQLMTRYARCSLFASQCAHKRKALLHNAHISVRH